MVDFPFERNYVSFQRLPNMEKTAAVALASVLVLAGVIGGVTVSLDSDDVPVLQEVLLTSSAPFDGDTDNDGLVDDRELELGTDPTSSDTDGDGLRDAEEVNVHRTEPTEADTDADGLGDQQEVDSSTSPTNADTDGDRLPDGAELERDTDPTEPDSDKDGLNDGEEVNGYQTDPTSSDTDSDGLDDEEEVKQYNTSPTCTDTDGDDVNDRQEVNGETNPTVADTDDDGLDDGQEVDGHTSPVQTDTDQDGLKDGREDEVGTDPTDSDTDGDGLKDGTEQRIGTDPIAKDSDADGRSDYEEYNTSGLDPTRQEVQVKESPQVGWENATLRKETRRAVEFFGTLPKNRTERNRTVTEAATTICNGHDRVVSGTGANATSAGGEIYRDTYRIEHAAKTMHDIGANIDVGTVQRRMQMARQYSGLAAQYSPIVGSYHRLHNSSCAVKRGEPGAKEDFYIATAEFTVDLVLAKEGVIYKAAFTTTGMASRAVGVNRLARVCGYKCVGFVQSEFHWLVRGTYSGALDTVSKEAIKGNLTREGWNKSVRRDVGEYVENKSNATLVGTELVAESKVVNCVKRNLDNSSLWQVAGNFSEEAVNTLRMVLMEGELPEDKSLSFLMEIDSVHSCLAN